MKFKILNFGVQSQFGVSNEQDLNNHDHVLKYDNGDFNKREDNKIPLSDSQIPNNNGPVNNQNFQAQESYPPRNNSYSQGYSGQYPPPPSNYGPYPSGYNFNAGMHYSSNNFSRAEIQKIRRVAIASIVIWFLSLVGIIAIVAIFASLIMPALTSAFNGDLTSNTTNNIGITNLLNNFPKLFIGSLIAIILLSLFTGISSLVCGIVGSVRTSHLARKDYEFNSKMILYILGCFFSLLQLIAAFMILSKIKSIHTKD